MRVPPDQKKYQITCVLYLHREIARQLMTGRKPKDIAASLNITPQTVSNVRNAPQVREHLEELHEGRDEEAKKLRDKVQKIVPVAVDILHEIMTDEDKKDEVRVRAALGILSSGMPKQEESGGGFVNTSVIQQIVIEADRRKHEKTFSDSRDVSSDPSDRDGSAEDSADSRS